MKNKKVIQSDKNIRKYIQSIWALSQEEADLFMKNIDKNRGQIDPKYLCHGHDLFSILEVITGSTIIPIKKVLLIVKIISFSYLWPTSQVMVARKCSLILLSMT